MKDANHVGFDSLTFAAPHCGLGSLCQHVAGHAVYGNSWTGRMDMRVKPQLIRCAMTFVRPIPETGGGSRGFYTVDIHFPFSTRILTPATRIEKAHRYLDMATAYPSLVPLPLSVSDVLTSSPRSRRRPTESQQPPMSHWQFERGMVPGVSCLGLVYSINRKPQSMLNVVVVYYFNERELNCSKFVVVA